MSDYSYEEQFENVDQLIQNMEQRRTRADEAILPKQREIVWGSHALKLYFSQGQGLLSIFLRVTPLEELINESVDDIERDYESDRYNTNYANGLRYGWHFSTVEPEGEFGSSHLVSLWPITEQEYSECEANGWVLTKECYERVRDEMAEAMKEAGIE